MVGYGNTTSLRGEGLGSERTGRRNRLHGIPLYALYIAGGWLLPGRKRVVPYSIQTLKRLKPAAFRQDLMALLDLLQQWTHCSATRAGSPCQCPKMPKRQLGIIGREASEVFFGSTHSNSPVGGGSW